MRREAERALDIQTSNESQTSHRTRGITSDRHHFEEFVMMMEGRHRGSLGVDYVTFTKGEARRRPQIFILNPTGLHSESSSTLQCRSALNIANTPCADDSENTNLNELSGSAKPLPLLISTHLVPLLPLSRVRFCSPFSP